MRRKVRKLGLSRETLVELSQWNSAVGGRPEPQTVPRTQCNDGVSACLCTTDVGFTCVTCVRACF
jgi:hypothetical protein